MFGCLVPSLLFGLVFICILQSEDLIEGLLQNGRLTFDQLVERTISKVQDGTAFSFIELVMGSSPVLFYDSALIPSLL
jgi:hypothetical protein